MHTRTLTGMQINTQGVVNAGRKQIFVPVQTSDTAIIIIIIIVTVTVLQSSEHTFHRFNDVPGELIAVSVLKAVDLTAVPLQVHFSNAAHNSIHVDEFDSLHVTQLLHP